MIHKDAGKEAYKYIINIIIKYYIYIYIILPMISAQLLSCVWLFATLWAIDCQAPLSMGFSRKAYWSVLAFPPPGDLPNPEIELKSPGLQIDSFTAEPLEKPHSITYIDN